MNEFNPARLEEQARERSGLEDFGPADYKEPLEIVAQSLDLEAPLSPAGRTASAARLVDLLADRLTLELWFRRHPEIAAEVIEPPVVVAGLPRTGTTLLYRMLAAAENFAAPIHFEAACVAPAPDWDFRPETDARIGAAKARVAAQLAATPELAAIYPLDAMAPEESLYLYAPSLRSTREQARAHLPSYERWFATADKRPAYAYLRRTLQFLQWQRRKSDRFGASDRWLLKGPDHMHSLDILLEVFPGAQIIQTHRDPLQTIPSICSLVRVHHSTTTSRDDSVEIGQSWSARFAASMERALGIRDAHPESFIDVYYQDTVSAPRKVAEDIFAFIGRELTPAAWASMSIWRDANRREMRPAHHYTLADFGLTEGRVKDMFARYRERFILHAR